MEERRKKTRWWKQRADFHQVAHTWLMCDGNWHKNAWFVDSCMGTQKCFVLRRHRNCVSTHRHRQLLGITRYIKCFVSLKLYIYIYYIHIYRSFLNLLEPSGVTSFRERYHRESSLGPLCFSPSFFLVLISSVWARRGHDANILTCDWWRRSCGWVDVNARYKRACKEPVFNLAVFSVQCPPDRVEPRVCVSNLVISLYTSSFSCFFETHTAAPW